MTSRIKKITCLILLIHSGLMLAQTETLVTINGKKVQINPNSINTANNGLSASNGNIQLGGDLTRASVLTTTAAFTLAIRGLQTGSNTDNIVVTDANGILKYIPGTSLAGDNLGNHTATETLVMGTNSINFNEADGMKIQFLNSTDASRIENNYGYILKTVAGKKASSAGQFVWSNYSGAGLTESEIMRINYDGKVGIGTSTPTGKLDVAGQTVTTSAQIKQGTDGLVPAAGYVATAADASGNIVWKAASPSTVMGIKVIDNNYTVAATDYTIIASKLTGDVTITLPTATSSTGRILVINQMGIANASGAAVAVKFNLPVVYSDTVSRNQILSDYYSAGTGGNLKVRLQSDGINWYVISTL